MPRRFYTLDVFTRDRCAGNPLAVITEAQGLDDTRMQAIAAEFNLPETVFVFPPEHPGHRATLRIFTPRRELPFAGHPTVGTAVLLALLDRGSPGQAAFTLEEKEGPVPCTIAITGPDHGRARFTLLTLPRRFGALCDRVTLARGLDVEPEEIGFGAHQPGIYSAGVPFAFVPLRSRDAVTRARPNGEAFTRAFDTVAQGFPNAYVYCANPIEPMHAYHARIFAPSMGIAEDPATGSAVAALAAVIMAFETPADGLHNFVIEQGDAMDRPSRITLSMDVSDGRLRQATISGEAVIVSEGHLRI